MRIIAGTLKGRKIASPQGEDTRPTVDRVREALFSSLYSSCGGFEGAVVLDAFAGSGALGIEALSRGASQAVFYESDRRAAQVVKRNLEALGLAAPVVQRDVLLSPPAVQVPPFTLVFLDPPYAYDPVEVLAMASALPADDPLIVYEHSLKASDAVACAAESAGLAVVSVRKYGKTGITMLKLGACRGAGGRGRR